MQCDVYKRLGRCEAIRLHRENAELRVKLLEREQIGFKMDECLVKTGKQVMALTEQLAEANASVAQIRAALEKCLNRLKHLSSPDAKFYSQDNTYWIEQVEKALSTTPSQVAERHKRIVEAE